MSISFQTGGEPIPGYKFLDRLGSGGFGEVWRCEAPGGIFKAAKVIYGDLRDKDNDAYRFVEQELKSLKRVKTVRHPYLLTLDRFDIVEGRLVIVMELADCNLWERFREHRIAGRPGIPREELLQYMAETAEVLDLMNDKHQLQHLDIKPQNLFLLYNHVKVADFGQVKDLEGLVASVTGGITPVYAAPETFDGFVSRFCDQYSLACVYQELLTGHRPFDGTSMQQLLMQHLQAPPNLLPSPANERSALAKALSKKPEDRFPNVSSMVKAIREGSVVRVNAAAPVAVGIGGSGSAPFDSYAMPSYPSDVAQGTSFPYGADGGYGVEADRTPNPRSVVETSVLPERAAPSAQIGPGPIRPAVVIGVGFTGLRILQQLRHAIEQSFGSMDNVPALRLIGIDSDPEAIELASSRTDGGQSPLPKDDLIAARLNRSAHYLKPRNNGRMVTEGWFDSQVFYKMTRQPATMGLRCLGRLAFCDHYRTILNKIQLELDACLDPQAIGETIARTGLDKRTNRPRVYIVAALGGGTGSGMFLDLAYAVRARLKRIGYAAPDLTGLLLTPPDTAANHPCTTALANTFAALTELNHFGDPDTVFEASYDDRFGNIRDAAAPFTRTFIIPGLDSSMPVSTGSGVRPLSSMRGSSGVESPNGMSRLSGVTRSAASVRTPAPRMGDPSDPLVAAVEFLRLDLLSNLGRTGDQARPLPTHPTGNEINTFGLSRFGWPRMDIVARTARIVAPVLFGNWVHPDSKQLRTVIPQWAEQQWHRFGLGSDRLAASLRDRADAAAGRSIDGLIATICDPLTPKGWRAKPPEPEVLAAALEQFTRLLGVPRESPNRVNTPVEDAILAGAADILKESDDELSGMLPALMDTPDFRFAGTEEAVRHLLNGVVAARENLQRDLAPLEAAAGAAYDCIVAGIHPHRGLKKPTAQEVAEALRRYPTDWYRALLARQISAVYRQLQTALQLRLAEVHSCRAKAQNYLMQLVAESETLAPPARAGDLLPVGCSSIEEAAQKFLKVLTDDDLGELEHAVQRDILTEFGGLYEACMNSSGGEKLLRILRGATRAYLNERLAAVDFAGMLKQKYSSKGAFGQAIAKIYNDAEPKLVTGGMWTRSEVAVFGAPETEGGAAIVQQASSLLPKNSTVVPTTDEAVVYREYSNVPLAALPQLGPVWAAAYHGAADLTQTSPHVRLDITQWRQIDG